MWLELELEICEVYCSYSRQWDLVFEKVTLAVFLVLFYKRNHSKKIQIKITISAAFVGK